MEGEPTLPGWNCCSEFCHATCQLCIGRRLMKKRYSRADEELIEQTLRDLSAPCGRGVIYRDRLLYCTRLRGHDFMCFGPVSGEGPYNYFFWWGANPRPGTPKALWTAAKMKLRELMRRS